MEAASGNQQFLISALEDAQEVVRAFDVKAEILGVFLTLLVGLLGIQYHHSSDPALWERVLAAIGAATMLVSMGCLGGLLWPSKKVIDRLDLGDFRPSHLYFLTKNDLNNMSVADLASKSKSVDWNTEIIWELAKVSVIRDRKRFWFNCALVFGALALVLEIVAAVSMWF